MPRDPRLGNNIARTTWPGSSPPPSQRTRSAALSEPRHYTPRSRLSRGSCSPRPPLRCSLGTDRCLGLRAANPQRSASWPLHLLRGSPEAPMMHRVGRDQHVAPVLQGRTTPTTTPPQEQAQGSDMPPLLARRRVVSTCTVLVLPSAKKGEDFGHLEGRHREEHIVTHAHITAA